MADFLVLEEDGTSHIELEEGTGSLLLEEAPAPPTPPPSYATWKAGTLTVPSGSGSVSITGLGGTPKAVFFFGTNFLAEDTPAPQTGAGLWRGMAAPKWDDPGTIVESYAFVSPASFLHSAGSKCIFALTPVAYSTALSTLYEASFTSFDADGFTVNFTTAASGGYKVVYVALMDTNEVGGYEGGSTTLALGWKAGNMLLHGAWAYPTQFNDRTQEWYGSAAYPGTFGPSWYGAGLAVQSFPTAPGIQYNLSLDNLPPGTLVVEDQTFVGPFMSTQNVTAIPSGGSLTDFTFSTNLGDNSGALVVWDDDDGQTGRVDPTPDNNTNTTTISGLPFPPGLVIGYSLSDEPQGQGSGQARNAAGLSVATEDFQWSAVVDGWDGGRYQSYQRGFADVVHLATAHAGTITLTTDGFIMETTEDSAAPSTWVWHAFGHPRPSPWIPQIYRFWRT